MTNPTDQPLYLRQDIQFEPLFNEWYAWFLCIPPIPAALNLSDRYLPIMKSYVASPMMHAAALKNPSMRGGPFIDLQGGRVEEVRELLARTVERGGAILELAQAIKQLNQLLLDKAKGLAMDPLYAEVPSILRGYVELYYDLNHSPSFRIYESLLYESQLYSSGAQSVALSVIAEHIQRPFILSTPRLRDPHTVFRPIGFADPVLDDLFRMREVPGSYTTIAARLGIEEGQQALFRSFFTETAPPRRDDRDFAGEDIRVRYYGHACLLIQSRGVSILLDPAVSYDYPNSLPRYTFADLPDHIDYVLITHSHHDHVVLETLLQLRHKVGTVLVGRNCDGFPQDPSIQLALRKLGFADVREVRDGDSLPVQGGSITAIPFLGEHNDLSIQSKNAFVLRFGRRSLLCIADSCNLEPALYDHVWSLIGQPDVLFLGMECEGAPPSWAYGTFFPKPIPREIDQSRRARGCNLSEATALIDHGGFEQAYVYAMGQEPWLNHILDNAFDENSPSLRQSTEFVALCQSRGLVSESLYGSKEIVICQK